MNISFSKIRMHVTVTWRTKIKYRKTVRRRTLFGKCEKEFLTQTAQILIFSASWTQSSKIASTGEITVEKEEILGSLVRPFVTGTGQVYFFFYLSLYRETSVRDKWNSHCFFPLCLLQISPILYSLPFNPLISIWWLETACEVAECVRQASEVKLNHCLCYRIQLQTCYCRQDQIPTEGYHEFLNPVIPM